MRGIKLKWITATSVAIAMAACGGGGDAVLARELPFTEVLSSAFSGVDTPQNVVVNDPTAWMQLPWPQDAPTRPAVNFTTETVVAVYLGRMPDSCRRPVIQSVATTERSTITVGYRIVGPDPAALCAAVITTPAQIVRFDNPARLPVEFELL